MKNKFFLINIIFLLIFSNYALTIETDLNNSDRVFKVNKNQIDTKNFEIEFKNEKIKIYGGQLILNKEKNQMQFFDDVQFFDDLNNIYIKSDDILFDKNMNIVKSKKNTVLIFNDKYKIYTSNLIYDKNNLIVYTNSETKIEDSNNNIFNIENYFNFDLNNEIISARYLNILDKNNNSYFFDTAKLNLKTNEIVGKEIKLDFDNGYFGNRNNDPVLKGNGIIFNNEETFISKAIFTTCDTSKRSCPGWEIQVNEFTHDKNEKLFKYKESWLKVFGKKFLYFPYFSHPDPTVKRTSGFLVPTIGNSKVNGGWLNIPYFKVIDLDKDFTFNPRVYADDKIILQSEYRQAFENSNFISDFSYNNDGKNSNAHFFSKIEGILDKEIEYKFQFQDVSNKDYLKANNLSKSSNIIENESLLTSSLFFEKNFSDDNSNLISEFIFYEDLTKSNNQKYQYILPNFNFTKNIDIPLEYNGNFTFQSFGFQKNYEINKHEILWVNDFLFNSNNFINNHGLVNDYSILVKNFNSYTQNSSKYEEKEDYEVFGLTQFKTSYPLKKINKQTISYLKPILALKYSPNSTKNISNNDVRINYDNIFLLERIGTKEIVEGGKSITLGVEYEINELNESNIFGFKLANSIRDKQNTNLPSKSKLHEKRSDLVGKLTYKFSEFLDLDYNFSLDNNLKQSNYDSILANLNFNNFNTSFEFISEDEELGNSELLRNVSKLIINKENSFNFKTTKDLHNDFTEFYSLDYVYQTDCIQTSVEFNKKYYKDGNLVPDENIFFSIKFIPFTQISSFGSSIK